MTSPQPVDRAALEEALAGLRKGAASWLEGNLASRVSVTMLNVILAAAEAHLATLPKTKMVEVWRVEWVYRVAIEDHELFWQPTARHYVSEHIARTTAKTLAGEGNNDCIRVTGPHLQEVPV